MGREKQNVPSVMERETPPVCFGELILAQDVVAQAESNVLPTDTDERRQRLASFEIVHHGIALADIAVKFGDDGSAQSLTSMGTFFDATSERIFEESGKGILASL